MHSSERRVRCRITHCWWWYWRRVRSHIIYGISLFIYGTSFMASQFLIIIYCCDSCECIEKKKNGKEMRNWKTHSNEIAMMHIAQCTMHTDGVIRLNPHVGKILMHFLWIIYGAHSFNSKHSLCKYKMITSILKWGNHAHNHDWLSTVKLLHFN